jgi:formate dehydrogenase subunit gamma
MANNRFKVVNGRIFRFTKTARLTHWIYACSYLLLLFTGLLLFTDAFDFLAPVFGGFVGAQMLHRVVAVIFLLPAVIFLLFDPKGFAGWLKECLTWTGDDFRMLPLFFKDLLGMKVDMPPQGFLNAGEKLNSLMTISFSVAIVASGFVKWFPGAFTVELVRWASVLHSGAVALMTPLVIVHIYLALINPDSKAALSGMLHGHVDAEFAKSHHEKWYKEVTAAKKS